MPTCDITNRNLRIWNFSMVKQQKISTYPSKIRTQTPSTFSHKFILRLIAHTGPTQSNKTSTEGSFKNNWEIIYFKFYKEGHLQNQCKAQILISKRIWGSHRGCFKRILWHPIIWWRIRVYKLPSSQRNETSDYN